MRSIKEHMSRLGRKESVRTVLPQTLSVPLKNLTCRPLVNIHNEGYERSV